MTDPINGLDELRGWVKRNAAHFRDYTTDEIIHLAIACGFQRQAIAAWQTEMATRQRPETNLEQCDHGAKPTPHVCPVCLGKI